MLFRNLGHLFSIVAPVTQAVALPHDHTGVGIDGNASAHDDHRSNHTLAARGAVDRYQFRVSGFITRTGWDYGDRCEIRGHTTLWGNRNEGPKETKFGDDRFHENHMYSGEAGGKGVKIGEWTREVHGTDWSNQWQIVMYEAGSLVWPDRLFMDYTHKDRQLARDPAHPERIKDLCEEQVMESQSKHGYAGAWEWCSEFVGTW